MSHMQHQQQRAARAFLSAPPRREDAPALPHAPVITGWKPHSMPRSDVGHMRISALTPIADACVDAMESELHALGLIAQGAHTLNKDAVADGEYLITADAPTYDAKHVQGLTITVNRVTFDHVIAPALDRWREEARGASIA